MKPLPDLQRKSALLLDMNGTFMFGEDRFGPTQNFAATYTALGGDGDPATINRLVRLAYAHLDARYPDPAYRHRFPSVASAFQAVADRVLRGEEMQRLVMTFARHECGHIPAAYATALRRLRSRYTIGFIADIWAPKQTWLAAFDRAGIRDVPVTTSFSSDHGFVKPSPVPFERIINALSVAKSDVVVIGDSVRRDLGGASAAGVDCVLVGGATDPGALANVENLLVLSERIMS